MENGYHNFFFLKQNAIIVLLNLILKNFERQTF